MHITTFYSFKGGVGRTQALVNVGVELALRGRRVLLVDFDLEAPGIDTYPLPKRYMYECPSVGKQGGHLWVMPSGHQDEGYARRLSEIDWRTLYADRSGYLLFEDLKEQWRQTLAPDYVLVDSRTGHSDVAGICTRQLPDSVVILFFPTDQNLRGLPKIVNDIRAEKTGPRKKAINLSFVMSNVPDLDDEDQILDSRIRVFSETLGYSNLSTIVHRYDSLALLNQVIFTADRPKSRLAREYHVLTDKIIEQNLHDREGALAFLRDITRRRKGASPKMSRTEIESRLTEIRRVHEDDAEIIQRLANLRMHEGRFEEADTLWTRLVEMGARTSHVLLRRAESRAMTGNRDGALGDVEALLNTAGTADFEVGRALGLLSSLSPERLTTVSQATAIQDLENEGRFWVATLLAREEQGLTSARDLLTQLHVTPSVPASLHDPVRNQLVLVLMGLGHVDEALKLIDESPTRDTSVAETFNRAMAAWASEGSPRKELFERVLGLNDDNGTANYAQCLAVTHAVLDQQEEASQRLNQARQRLASQPEPQFSCWRYRIVPAEEFLKDVEAIRDFVSDRSVRPRLLDFAPSHS
ncbi:MAG: hypothetical protein DMG02_08460 [Acidobacteria bacterium]|nr:MAG: hypothetical protein DMG02_08460 [Acidobacteriota bacterium]